MQIILNDGRILKTHGSTNVVMSAPDLISFIEAYEGEGGVEKVKTQVRVFKIAEVKAVHP